MLPNTYQLLNYLESTGTQYIDTGLKGNLNTRFVASVSQVTASTNNTFSIFGDNQTTSQSISLNLTASNGSSKTARFGDKSVASSTQWIFLDTVYKVEINKTGFYVDGYLRGSFNATNTFTTTNNLKMFYYDGMGSAYCDGTTRIYYAKIYNGNTLVRDYVPAKRLADDVLGMYDLANDVFYTNAGTGTFGYSDSQYSQETISVIPKMTSNTAPYGSVTTSSSYYDNRGTSYNYHAFDKISIDGTDNVRYMSENQSNGYLVYNFPNDVYVDGSNFYANGYGKVFTYKFSMYDTAWHDVVVNTLPQSTTTGAGGFAKYTIPAGGVLNKIRISSSTTKTSGTNMFVSEMDAYRNVQYGASPANVGLITHELVNSKVVVTALPIADDYVFSHWENYQNTNVSTNNVYALALNWYDDKITACFVTVNITYDSSLGSATYTDNLDGTVTLTATPNQNAQLIGWYIDSVLVSSSLSLPYSTTDDIDIEARFGIVYDVVTSTVGNGSVECIRGSDQNDITVSAIPDTHWHFQKFTVNGTEYYESPLVMSLHADADITAYFEEDDRAHISVMANIPDASIYVSHNDDYPTYESTLYARPLADYQFVKWEDGSTDNPRTITVENSIGVLATYHRMAEEPDIYPYRCYIKDQLHLTDPPIAFLRVKSFDIKTDLLTNSNSTIKTIDDSSAIDNGDILVLYDPKGRTLYQGVIKSMKSKDTNTFGDMNNDQNHEMEITCSQMQSFYKGNWIYNVHPSNTLEQEIAYLLGQYAQGKLYKCSWTDALVAQRLGGITVQYTGSTSAKLPTDKDENDEEQLSTMDMEDFIYALYEEYGIIFDFEINFSGANYVHIKVPTYTTLKVGNNMFAIKNMSPITEVEEVNKLVIFASDKTYRTTYIATTTGIVQTPATTANRFNITNTEIVFSDDAAADLVSAYLPATMYNHKLTFDLLIKNFIYDFGDFNLGGSLDVWHGEDYYNTVLTGYEIKKNENQNITEVHFICGKVRTALTKKLTMGTV